MVGTASAAPWTEADDRRRVASIHAEFRARSAMTNSGANEPAELVEHRPVSLHHHPKCSVSSPDSPVPRRPRGRCRPQASSHSHPTPRCLRPQRADQRLSRLSIRSGGVAPCPASLGFVDEPGLPAPRPEPVASAIAAPQGQPAGGHRPRSHSLSPSAHAGRQQHGRHRRRTRVSGGRRPGPRSADVAAAGPPARPCRPASGAGSGAAGESWLTRLGGERRSRSGERLVVAAWRPCGRSLLKDVLVLRRPVLPPV